MGLDPVAILHPNKHAAHCVGVAGGQQRAPPGQTLISQRPGLEPRAPTCVNGGSKWWGVVEVAAAFGGSLTALGAVAVAALASPLDLDRGPLQRGADLVGLDDRPLVALRRLPAPLAQPQARRLIVTEVNPTTIPGGELTHLIDDQVAALARQLLSRVELRTIRS
jgi:hypothetical protein